jgi:hypothetical protein
MDLADVASSGSYTDLINTPTLIKAAVPWSANHTIADGTRYLVGDVVYDDGNIFVANFENESIPTSSELYWTNLGPGNRLNIDGRDIPNISYTQLTNKPFIPTIPDQTSNTGKYLTTDGSALSWSTVTDGVTDYNNLTNKPDLSVYYLATNPSGYITGITSSNVTTALGFTPYDAANPNAYITDAVTISDSAPTLPSGGNLWWNSTEGTLKIYYSDADSSQWVDTISNGIKGDTGLQGVKGDTGANGIYVGESAPVDTSILWLDTSDTSGVGVYGIPVGGTTNQVLVKSSDTDYDVNWTNQSGGYLKSIATITSSTALGSTARTDYYYFVSSALSTTQTLPTAVGNTNTYVIKNLSSTGVVNIATTASQTIDEAASYMISSQNHSITLISDGANWRII